MIGVRRARRSEEAPKVQKKCFIFKLQITQQKRQFANK